MNQRNLLESLLIIRNDARFRDVAEWFDAKQNEALAVMRSAEGAKLHQAQGAYNVMQQLKDLIDAAPEQLDKMARGNSLI